MLRETFEAGPLGCNCSVLCCPVTKQAIVVDPGGDYPKIKNRLDAFGAAVVAIVHTHTHIDHVGATADLQDLSGADACIHEADRFLYDMLPIQAAMLGITEPRKVDMRGSLSDGTAIRFGNFELGVLHTPGHTPGSVSFVVSHDGKKTLFAGDTLFKRGIGRTDLWGGDHDLILKSLHEKLLTQEDDARVITGHGPETTIGDERRSNPFLVRR